MRWSDVSVDDIQRVKALAARQLSAQELEAYVRQPMAAAEQEEIEALLDWFARRYPTPAERLRYARTAYRRWTRGSGSAR